MTAPTGQQDQASMSGKKDIAVLFKAIRYGDLAGVVRSLEAEPALVNARGSAPPQMYDGYCALQMACLCGQWDIASLLLDHGAAADDAREMEGGKRMPVLNDALHSASKLAGSDGFDTALIVLKRMLQFGADPNRIDLHGNSPLYRSLIDARLRLNLEKAKGPLVVVHLQAIFDALLAAGADAEAAKSQVSKRAFAGEFGLLFDRFIH